MSHSEDGNEMGIIDKGDTICYESTPNREDLITYVEGRANGYQRYGDYGDVIVFRRNGQPSAIPIVHRLFVHLEWNQTTDNSFDIPDLEGLEIYMEWGAVNSDGGIAKSHHNLTGYVWINDVGYTHKNMTITLQSFILALKGSGEEHDIYLTAGDHNLEITSQPDVWYVLQEWIEGKVTRLIDK